jgi:hypothetical protein
MFAHNACLAARSRSAPPGRVDRGRIGTKSHPSRRSDRARTAGPAGKRSRRRPIGKARPSYKGTPPRDQRRRRAPRRPHSATPSTSDRRGTTRSCPCFPARGRTSRCPARSRCNPRAWRRSDRCASPGNCARFYPHSRLHTAPARSRRSPARWRNRARPPSSVWSPPRRRQFRQSPGSPRRSGPAARDTTRGGPQHDRVGERRVLPERPRSSRRRWTPRSGPPSATTEGYSQRAPPVGRL